MPRKFAPVVGTQALLIALIAPGLSVAAPANADAPPKASLVCNIGPIVRKHGGTDWLFYSCVDGRSLIAVSRPGSAASPFVFVFTPVDAGYQLSGEGTGTKSATDAAYRDLNSLPPDQVRTLIRASRDAWFAAGNPGQPTTGLRDGRDAFDIDLPSSCNITTKGRGIDFQVFYVQCNGLDYAGVYVGNAADTATPRSRLLMTSYSWPAEVQVWSTIVAGHQEEADRIATSVRLRPPLPPKN